MLLIHQAGSVKVGEVVRYTVTYTPHRDRVLPTPSHLHLKVKNTSAIPLRAAWVHGPYALHVGAYPASFNPHQKVEDPEGHGVPEYEPMIKAGGSWSCKLRVPDEIRVGRDGKKIESRASSSAGRKAMEIDDGKSGSQDCKDKDSEDSVTWIVEVASQILFSNSASVGYEVLIGRDERGLDLGFAAVAAHGHGGPGTLKEGLTEKDRQEARKNGNVFTEGVYSRAIRLVVEDTETLWDKPELPTWEGCDNTTDDDKKKERKRRKVHLVIVTHGLHSNIGADMLFLKESIDATVKQARVEATKRKQKYKSASADKKRSDDDNETSTAPLSGGQEDLDNDTCASDDEEETIVRGFTGNAIRTENGIQYLGKRLAKYILRFTYPDQPFLPIKKSFSKKLSDSFSTEAERARREGREGKSVHSHSSIHHPLHGKKPEDLPYKFTSISFIGHSLGGLIQTYAIAYIQKHAPHFFEQVQPVNFICMASPMLGLSNENPMYVKFALDFGLVGRTGQDLGLTWRPPTMARNGWNALLEGFGGALNNNGNKDGDKKKDEAAAKPLLRVLPSGPAHTVLKMFRNRTVYSNVVNDGIVPLRTSCLLFLDWRGLGKVEKARRENGLIGTMAEWGWAELTGTNSTTRIEQKMLAERQELAEATDDKNEHVKQGQGETVPQPGENETTDDNRRAPERISSEREMSAKRKASSSSLKKQSGDGDKGMLDTFLGWLRPNDRNKSPATPSKKTSRAIRRAQTIGLSPDSMDSGEESPGEHDGSRSNPTIRPSTVRLHSGTKENKRPPATRGDSLTDQEAGDVLAPPKTSIFESAGDLLHPPLPDKQWISDPSTRSRTIFHDRVYHPEDIPPPPVKRASTRLGLRSSVDANSDGSSERSPPTKIDTGSMKVEEKIARAYHKDLSWRKVLVRLEPDAHNNMIVRRMFANAYGWPVIKHLCDTHFADTYSANTRDEDEPARERAPPMTEPVPAETGEEVADQTAKHVRIDSQSELREARDELADLNSPKAGTTGPPSRKSSVRSGLSRADSDDWDDRFFEASDGEDSDAVDERNLVSRILNPHNSAKKPNPGHSFPREETEKSIATPPGSPGFTDGHRGLAPVSPLTPLRPASRRKSNASVGAPSSPVQRRASTMHPTFDAGDLEGPLIGNKLVEEPQELQSPVLSPGSSSEVGLRKSTEEGGQGSLPALANITNIIGGGGKGVNGGKKSQEDSRK